MTSYLHNYTHIYIKTCVYIQILFFCFYLSIGATKAAEIGVIVVVVAGIILGILERKLNLCEHKVVGLVL